MITALVVLYFVLVVKSKYVAVELITNYWLDFIMFIVLISIPLSCILRVCCLPLDLANKLKILIRASRQLVLHWWETREFSTVWCWALDCQETTSYGLRRRQIGQLRRRCLIAAARRVFWVAHRPAEIGGGGVPRRQFLSQNSRHDKPPPPSVDEFQARDKRTDKQIIRRTSPSRRALPQKQGL